MRGSSSTFATEKSPFLPIQSSFSPFTPGFGCDSIPIFAFPHLYSNFVVSTYECHCEIPKSCNLVSCFLRGEGSGSGGVYTDFFNSNNFEKQKSIRCCGRPNFTNSEAWTGLHKPHRRHYMRIVNDETIKPVAAQARIQHRHKAMYKKFCYWKTPLKHWRS